MPEEIIFPKNLGVILEDQKPTDYIFGYASPVAENITLLPGELWNQYLVRAERQFGVYFDSMGCVTFSALSVLEMIFKYQLAHNMISAGNVRWLRENGYFNAQGEIEFSDRFTAKMAGTTENGNSLSRVGDSIRSLHGLVPESVWTWDWNQRQPVFDWNDFYAEIPQRVKDLGQEFLKRFKINYQIVYTSFPEMVAAAYTHSPLQLVGHAWPRPVNGIYPRTTEALNHAFVGFQPQTFIFDTYAEDGRYGTDFIKQLAPDFIFHNTAFKFIVNEKFMENNFVKIIKDKNSAAVGFFVPATQPSALETMALAFNKKIERQANGDIDWGKTIEGEMELKPGEEISEQ